MNTQAQMASIDDLLDGTLDDLADMPEFKPFAAGAHVCKISWEVTAINNIPTVKMKLTHVETSELANADDTPPKAGDTAEVAFMLKKSDGTKNELSEGQWKEILASIKTGLGLESATNREIMSASEGMEMLVVTGIRTDKRDPQNVKHYLSVKSVAVI